MKNFLFVALILTSCMIQAQSKNEELFKAIDDGNLGKVKALIEADNSLLETKDERGSTPLIRAGINPRTLKRQPEIARFLIEKGANVNVVNNWLHTPLISVCVGYGPDYDLIKLLIAKGANVNSMGINGITPLHWAAHYGDLKVAKLLLDNGADINIYDKFNGEMQPSSIYGTILQVAINANHESIDIAKLLIERGAKLNKIDSEGNTELHLAALSGNSDLAKLLIQHGAELNAINYYKRTPLYYAAKSGYKKVNDVLIEAGADKKNIAEENFGKAKQLEQKLNNDEAYLWYLDDYNYVVKTRDNFLVFAIENLIKESPESGLANGALNPNELAGQKITMFLNHRSYYQMEGENFKKLAKLIPGVVVVAGFKPDFGKEYNNDIPPYRFAQPNENFNINSINVHTIPALNGGLGYLVEVDGLKIFHAGLHISSNADSIVTLFRKEVDFLKPFGPVDIVMLSVWSHSNRMATSYEPFLYMLDQLSPKAIFLRAANNPGQYIKCAEVLRARTIPVFHPEGKGANGSRFHYIRE